MKVQRTMPRLLYILISIPLLLLIPLLAMQFSAEVDWSSSDFIIMGGLLLLAGLALEGILRLVKSRGGRFLSVALLAVLFLLIYAELAVGVFGSPWAGS